jgi:hypothetical protein
MPGIGSEIGESVRDKTGRFQKGNVTNLMQPQIDNAPDLPLGYQTVIGDGNCRVFTVAHNLGTKEVYVSLRHKQEPQLEIMGGPFGPSMFVLENEIEFQFSKKLPPPALNSIEVRVMK